MVLSFHPLFHSSLSLLFISYLSDGGRVEVREQLLGALDEQGVEGAGVVPVFVFVFF